MHGESVSTVETSICSTDKLDASLNQQLPAPAPEGPYAMGVHWDDGSYDVESFPCMALYGVQIFVSITLIAMCTVASIVDTGAGSKLVNKNFLPPALRKSLKTIKSPQLPPANRKVVFVEGTVPLGSHWRHLRARLSWSSQEPCFECATWEFIHWRGIFPFGQNVFQCLSQAVAILPTQKIFNAITANKKKSTYIQLQT